DDRRAPAALEAAIQRSARERAADRSRPHQHRRNRASRLHVCVAGESARSGAPGADRSARLSVERENVKEPSNRSRHERIVSWLVNTLLVIAIVMAGGIVVPAGLGFHKDVINGHSMGPTCPDGGVT